MAFIQTKALLYMIVDRVVNKESATHAMAYEALPLIDAINNNLSSEHKLKPASSNGDFYLSLSSVTPQDAMQAARLVRNAFQQRQSPDRNDYVCIGLIVHHQDVSYTNYFMEKARELALKACETPGNNIEYLDLTRF